MDENKRKSGGLYKNVTVPVKVLNAFIIVGTVALFAITFTAIVLKILSV